MALHGTELLAHLRARHEADQDRRHHARLVAAVVRPWPITNIGGVGGERGMVPVDRAAFGERGNLGLGVRVENWWRIENEEYWRGAWVEQITTATLRRG